MACMNSGMSCHGTKFNVRDYMEGKGGARNDAEMCGVTRTNPEYDGMA